MNIYNLIVNIGNFLNTFLSVILCIRYLIEINVHLSNYILVHIASFYKSSSTLIHSYSEMHTYKEIKVCLQVSEYVINLIRPVLITLASHTHVISLATYMCRYLPNYASSCRMFD